MTIEIARPAAESPALDAAQIEAVEYDLHAVDRAAQALEASLWALKNHPMDMELMIEVGRIQRAVAAFNELLAQREAPAAPALPAEITILPE